MSEEQKIVQETPAVIVEEQAPPALPTTEPPKDDVGKPAEADVRFKSVYLTNGYIRTH